MKSATIILTALLVCGFTLLGWSALARQKALYATPKQSGRQRPADRMQAKLDRIERNAKRSHPDPSPTVMSEEEINDYLASGRMKMPQGVRKIRLQGRSGKVDAFLTVDFDEIRQHQRSSNPLLAIFSGTHDVAVEADADGAAGLGKIHVRTVSVDDIEVPSMALEYFVEKYITPKHPNVGMDSTFQLPDKIDTAMVGYHKLTVIQK